MFCVEPPPTSPHPTHRPLTSSRLHSRPSALLLEMFDFHTFSENPAKQTFWARAMGSKATNRQRTDIWLYLVGTPSHRMAFQFLPCSTELNNPKISQQEALESRCLTPFVCCRRARLVMSITYLWTGAIRWGFATLPRGLLGAPSTPLRSSALV